MIYTGRYSYFPVSTLIVVSVAIILGLGLSNLVDRIIPGRIIASAKNMDHPVILNRRCIPRPESDDQELI